MSKKIQAEDPAEKLPAAVSGESATEKALAASELRYRRLFESAKDGILILDAETGIVVDVNPFLLDLLDYPYEEFVGKAIWELGFFRDIVANQDNFTELRENEYIRYENKPLEDSAGHRHEVEFISNVYLVNDKNVIQCNIRDITQRKQAEAAVRASRQLLEGIINTIPVRVFWKDEQLVYLGGNAAFAHDAGFDDPKDLIGKNDFQMSWRDQAELYQADDRKVIESGTPQLLIEEPRTTPDGNILSLLTNKVPLRDSNGEICGVIGAYLDITGRKQEEKEREELQAQLTQAQKMDSVGRLAGGVAHDFNNMLQVILGYTELGLGKIDPANPLFTNLTEIQNAAQRSGALTGQLLTFAREQPILPIILNLNDEISNLLNMLRRLLREDIEILWRPDENLKRVKLDPVQVDQILVNLCVNAQDAVADGGKIIIETGNATLDEAYCTKHTEAVPGEYACLAVSDNGCGMRRETIEKIFEPFFTTKEKGKGTGLGLSTVYGIVRQNNGFIYVYSEPELGTTFKIYLPQAEDTHSDTSEHDTPPLPEVHGEIILLVEDEPSLRPLYHQFLDDLGYTVLMAETPQDALELFSQQPDNIQLLLTDVVMPEMNGKQLADAIRAVNPSVKILFMSGYTTDVITEHGVLDHDVAFIAKPFSCSELAHKLQETLRARATKKGVL